MNFDEFLERIRFRMFLRRIRRLFRHRSPASRWGGCLDYWEREAALAASTKPKFREISLKLDKLVRFYQEQEKIIAEAKALGAAAAAALKEEGG